MANARGTFEVQLTPQTSDTGAGDTLPTRRAIDKRFHGDLAIERVRGGTPELAIKVVPDSGTEGLVGRMAITIADGKHSYDFEYTLAGAR